MLGIKAEKYHSLFGPLNIKDKFDHLDMMRSDVKSEGQYMKISRMCFYCNFLIALLKLFMFHSAHET